MDHANPAYLEAKQTVDDRALDRRVRDCLLANLPASPRILEAGAGTGVTVPRLLDWGVTGAEYVGVDRSAAVLDRARERCRTDLNATETEAGLQVGDLAIRFERGDALAAFGDDRADLVVAQSFLDLVPLAAAIDAFSAALAPGGLVYAPLTFDGVTLFAPDHPADDAILSAYHAHIDEAAGRDARAGRHAIEQFGRREGDLLAVGSSDWIVRPQGDSYRADEREFVAAILGFVADAVGGHPDAAEWLATRREQLAAGELCYVAHQYDLLYRVQEA